MKGTFTQEIIKGFNQFYNYGVIELAMGDYESKWALVKSLNENKKRVVIFVNDLKLLNYEELLNYLQTTLNSEEVELIRIYIKKRNDMVPIDSQFESQAELILDIENKRIEVSKIGNEDFVQEFLNVTNNIQSEVENKKVDMQFVTMTLIAVNVIMYIFTAFLSGDIFNSDINVLIRLGAKNNDLIAAGEYYRLITCMFLHGGLLHLVLNMYSLYAIGPLVERIYGKVKYVSIYFISGITASVFSFIFSTSTSIGASGAIFGLLGTTLIFAYKMRKNLGKAFLKNIATVIAINLFIGFSVQGIDNYGHLGGLIGGAVMGLLFYNKND